MGPTSQIERKRSEEEAWAVFSILFLPSAELVDRLDADNGGLDEDCQHTGQKNEVVQEQ